VRRRKNQRVFCKLSLQENGGGGRRQVQKSPSHTILDGGLGYYVRSMCISYPCADTPLLLFLILPLLGLLGHLDMSWIKRKLSYKFTVISIQRNLRNSEQKKGKNKNSKATIYSSKMCAQYIVHV
jgi:hypothetical protein